MDRQNDDGRETRPTTTQFQNLKICRLAVQTYLKLADRLICRLEYREKDRLGRERWHRRERWKH